MAPKLLKKTPKLFPANATLAPPRFSKIQDRGNSHQSWKFFEYWKECAGTIAEPTEHADLVEVRFYMHWPVVSLKMVDPSRTDTVFKMFTGSIWFDDPEAYIEECMKELGSGGWHVVLNEANVHGALCEAYFSAIDLDRYPVKIDLRTLVRGDSKNADYVRWLGVNGIKTPWDNPEDEDDMANSDALKIVADVLRDQSQTAIETTKELADVRVEAAQEEAARAREQVSESKAAGTIDAAVVNAGMELLANAANKSIDMVAQHAGSQLNTVEVMKTAAELFRPQTDHGTTMLLEALKDQSTKMIQMQESNQEFMRSVIGMKKNPDGTWSAGAEHSSGGIEGELARFQRLADILGWQKPGQAVQSTTAAPVVEHPPEKGILSAIAENIGPFSAMLTTVTVLLANMVYNFRADPGKQTSPQEALQRAQAQAPPPPPPQAQQQQTDPRDLRNWVTFAKQIEQPFKVHLRGQDQGLNGFSFAEFILSSGTGGGTNPAGRKAYMSIKENLGPAGFDKLVQGMPALWEEMKATPDAYRKFMEEFFSYDEMMAAQQQPAGAAV